MNEIGVGLVGQVGRMYSRLLPPDDLPVPPNFDAFASVGAALTGTATAALTVGAGVTNGIVLALVIFEDAFGSGGAVDTITFGGVAMTLVPGSAISAGNSVAWLYALMNPPTGAHDCALGMSDPGNLVLAVASYGGVNQATPFAATATNTNVGTTPNVDVELLPNNLAFFAVLTDIGAGTSTVTGAGNVTVEGSRVIGSAPDITRGTLGDDYLDSGSPFHLAVTQSTSKPWAIVALELAHV